MNSELKKILYKYYPKEEMVNKGTIINDMINNTISKLPLDGTCDEKIIAMLIM